LEKVETIAFLCQDPAQKYDASFNIIINITTNIIIIDGFNVA